MAKKLLLIVHDPEKYQRVFSFDFGIWLDLTGGRRNGWNVDDVSKNDFTPDEIEASVREALHIADEYVSVSSKTPRWWSAEGKPVKLPQAYDAALRRARGEQTGHTRP
ncbi:MAG: hypothetical protein EXS31_02950 [Pedosphaera sp.]|nr:hypothetical protein [Pedosphaera sp.]